MKVLFIDDEPMILKMAGFILKKGGYECVTAGSGEEGIRLCKESCPEMIFIDVEMPGMNGFETLEELKKSSVNARICMMSGTINEEVMRKARALGAVGIIEKPLNAQVVYSMIEGSEEE